MDAKLDQLIGTWLHSHEEDTATERVYRRSDFAFPPSRGRNGYEFRPDHTCTYMGIAARDGATKQLCTWQLRDGTDREIVLTFPDGQQRVVQIITVDRERLLIMKT